MLRLTVGLYLLWRLGSELMVQIELCLAIIVLLLYIGLYIITFILALCKYRKNELPIMSGMAP